ncbi:MAG: hypothetical protein PHX08_08120 [Lachnospiraceae bacterium]|nr:hypothetical protein [Lachnospiraceae bacterium]
MTTDEKRKVLSKHCNSTFCDLCEIGNKNFNRTCGLGHGYESNTVSKEEIDINYAIVFGESKEVDETAISPLDLILSEIKQLTTEAHELKQAIIDLTAEGEC